MSVLNSLNFLGPVVEEERLCSLVFGDVGMPAFVAAKTPILGSY